MTRCLSCNGILRTQEKSCFVCGAAAVELKRPTGKRLAGIITAVFIASLLLTAASFFSDRTPPFSACLAASVVMLFVKRSADQFTG